jgi:hypothetical protein
VQEQRVDQLHRRNGCKESETAAISDLVDDGERHEANHCRRGAQDEEPQGPAQLEGILEEVAQACRESATVGRSET